MKNILFTLLTAVMVSACGGSEKSKTITIKDQYSLNVPFDMKASTELNDDASLQYEDMWEDFYVIVIDETKDEMQEAIEMFDMGEEYENNLENYADIIIAGFSMEMEEAPAELMDTTINDMGAKVARMTMSTMGDNFEEINVHYSMLIAEGKDNYYQVMVWTLAENEFKYKAKIDNILFSLKEVDSNAMSDMD